MDPGVLVLALNFQPEPVATRPGCFVLMSALVYAWIWDHSKCEPEVKFTLLALAEYANREGESCYPRLNTIARMVGRDVRTVQRHLRAAQAAGELQITPHYNTSGFQTTNSYRFTGMTPTSPGDTDVTPGVTPMSPVGGDTDVTPKTPLKEQNLLIGTKERGPAAPVTVSQGSVFGGNGKEEFKLQAPSPSKVNAPVRLNPPDKESFFAYGVKIMGFKEEHVREVWNEMKQRNWRLGDKGQRELYDWKSMLRTWVRRRQQWDKDNELLHRSRR